MREKRGRGRESMLTQERHDKIVEIIKAGNYENVAWMQSGICEETYYGWKKRGKEALALLKKKEEVAESELVYVEFFQSIKEAIAYSEEYAVSKVRVHMDTSWQAAMTYLERKFPDRWGKKDRLTVEVNTMVTDALKEICDAIEDHRPDIKEGFEDVLEWMASKK